MPRRRMPRRRMTSASPAHSPCVSSPPSPSFWSRVQRLCGLVWRDPFWQEIFCTGFLLFVAYGAIPHMYISAGLWGDEALHCHPFAFLNGSSSAHCSLFGLLVTLPTWIAYTIGTANVVAVIAGSVYYDIAKPFACSLLVVYYDLSEKWKRTAMD